MSCHSQPFAVPVLSATSLLLLSEHFLCLHARLAAAAQPELARVCALIGHLLAIYYCYYGLGLVTVRVRTHARPPPSSNARQRKRPALRLFAHVGLVVFFFLSCSQFTATLSVDNQGPAPRARSS